MQTSDQINELAAALAKAQGAFGNVAKNREVSVTSKRTGAKYKFKYATLDAIQESVRKPLAENGLAYIQAVTKEASAHSIDTRLMHSSGQWIQTVTPITIEEGGNQAIGSAITYGRRYALSALLGIVSEEDDDGNASDGNHIDQSRDVQRHGPTDNGPVPQERTMTKQQARPEYDALLKEILSQPDVTSLQGWGAKAKARIALLPEDWQMSLKNEYADHKSNLLKVAAQ